MKQSRNLTREATRTRKLLAKADVLCALLEDANAVVTWDRDFEPVEGTKRMRGAVTLELDRVSYGALVTMLKLARSARDDE